MLISTEVDIELTNRNRKRILNNYNLDKKLKIGDIAKIPLKDLSKSSNYKVEVSCDYCNKLLKIPYKRYNLSIKNVNKNSCSSKECANQKIKDVCQSKYGVDNPFQDENIKSKIKETMNEKYGVDHPMLSDDIKNKLKNTCLERYGVDSYTKTDEYIKKTIETNIKKYGVKWSLQSDEIRNKGYETNLKRYGVKYTQSSPIIRNKTIKTNMENYGYPSNMQSDISKNKLKKSTVEKYGVEHIMFLEETKDKIKKTCLDKYGTNSYTQTKEFKERVKETNLERYGSNSPNMSDLIRKEKFIIAKDQSYIEYLGNNVSLFSCERGHNFEISTSQYFNRNRDNISSLCTICNPISDSQSIKEKELFNFIKSVYKDKIIQSYRDRLEIDIYLPKIKLGFEFNGLYWHSEKFKDKKYHINKTNYYKEKGIKIIHIWEDDWSFKKEIIKSQIKNWLGVSKKRIYGRKCEIKEIENSKIKNEFLNKNHIQGKDKSKIKLGLYYNDDLVSIMTFSKFAGRKKLPNDEWNLNRFCNKLNTNVIGGFSKLLKYFLRNYDPIRITSYADKDWSDGKIYKDTGFNLISDNKPDYKYILNNKRVHKSRFRKSNLNTNLSESQYMKKSHIEKIWDCGKLKFEFNL